MDLLITAKRIADRVEAESLKQNVPVAVAVIDTHADVVLIHRMTGAPAFSPRALRAKGLHIRARRRARR
jgi:uncharacterized protein GlcG (DUF336 family)